MSEMDLEHTLPVVEDTTEPTTGDPIPDHLASAEPVPPREMPEALRNAKRTIGRAGQNKKARPTVRKTKSGELVKPVAKFYGLAAMAIAPVRPKTGHALMVQAMACATAWDNLAQENDSVRRVILWCIESGIWGEMVVAHMPILFSLLPDEISDNMPGWLADLFSTPEPSDSNGQVPDNVVNLP